MARALTALEEAFVESLRADEIISEKQEEMIRNNPDNSFNSQQFRAFLAGARFGRDAANDAVTIPADPRQSGT